MDRREAGRLGGLRTFELYGREHMRRIGKLGFAALARRYGCRRGALHHLIKLGAVPPPRELTVAEMAELYQLVGLADDPTETTP